MSEQQPTLQLIRGDAEPEELAALLAVLSARGSGAPSDPAAPSRPRGRWGDPASAVAGTPHAGPGAWRASGLPR